jgi:hypothetical protein
MKSIYQYTNRKLHMSILTIVHPRHCQDMTERKTSYQSTRSAPIISWIWYIIPRRATFGSLRVSKSCQMEIYPVTHFNSFHSMQFSPTSLIGQTKYSNIIPKHVPLYCTQTLKMTCTQTLKMTCTQTLKMTCTQTLKSDLHADTQNDLHADTQNDMQVICVIYFLGLQYIVLKITATNLPISLDKSRAPSKCWISLKKSYFCGLKMPPTACCFKLITGNQLLRCKHMIIHHHSCVAWNLGECSCAGLANPGQCCH